MWLTFNGASQYSIPTSTTPFTIEFWIKPNASGGVVFTEQYTGAANSISIVCSLATSTAVETAAGLFPAFGWYNGSAWTTAAVSTTAIVLNTWSHVAFVFTGSTSKVYINGTDVTKSSTPTPATTWGITGVSGDGWTIGRQWSSSAQYVSGNISNLRFVNGTAVYTSNFTVPYTLTAITNTVLLTCQPTAIPGFITDNSSYGATITNNGQATIVADNPYPTPAPYNPALGAATPGVWTLSQANRAAAQRSWNMYDPYFNYATAMVHGNGTNGGTNNTFLDSSSNNFTVTRNGNATQGTFTPFCKPNGYWSNYFDGTGDYIQISGGSGLAFGTGDFTIEFYFIYNRLVNTNVALYDGRDNSVAQAVPYIHLTTNLTLTYTANGTGITTTAVPSTGIWNHVAASRVSGSTRLFLNGVQVGSTFADSINYVSNAGRPYLGTQGYGTAAFMLDGNISNLRVLKGTGLYTTTFTPPTAPLTAITNTQLLTCQSNLFVDNSANAYSITAFGDTRAVPYSPFYAPTAYLPQNNGGAMYFDGTGDYLTLTGSSNLAFGTSDFTIECFVYYTSIAANSFLYDSRPNGTLTGLYPTIYNDVTAKTFVFYTNGAARLTSNANVLVAGAWTHLVISRVSGTTRMFVNGTLQTATYADTNSYLNGAARPIVSADGNSQGTAPLTGFVSNLRVLNGTGVTSVTVPTAPLTAITNTQLLLSGTNSSFVDNAANLFIETVNTSISTAQSKYGSGSMSFNGSSTYAKITTPFGDGRRVVQTLGDFTIECWVNPTTVNAQRCIYNVNTNATGYGAVRLDHASGGAVQILVSTTGAAYAINTTSSSILSTGSWTHLAVVRTGGAIIVYVNGSAVITSTAVTSTTALVEGTQSLIGALSLSGTLGNYFDGYISDFRATNVARYQGGFTPPTSTLQNQ